MNFDFLTDIGQGINNLWVLIKTIFSTIATVLVDFYNAIEDLRVDIIESYSTGNYKGLPLFEMLGTYRYLVGEPIFYFTYLCISFGCFFTVYKLVVLIINLIINNSFMKKYSSKTGVTTQNFKSPL